MSIVGRLIEAIDGAQRQESIVQNQLQRVRDRLRAGVTTDGAPFAPYADPPRPDRLRPLVAGAKLIDAAQVSSSTSLEGADLVATIEGQAGVIAAAQNKLRPFAGFSDNDRQTVISDFVSAMKSNCK